MRELTVLRLPRFASRGCQLVVLMQVLPQLANIEPLMSDRMAITFLKLDSDA